MLLNTQTRQEIVKETMVHVETQMKKLL
jgi:hypothetical protein